jgi:magnesium-transporting ATPase (P-type)
MCKGADSIVLPRCTILSTRDRESRALTERHLDEFAREGLRTLVMAQRVIGEREFIEYANKHDALKKAAGDPLKEEKINQMFDDMEQGLEYVGCTAIEDKLQENVPQTISKILEMKIRLWVLTGDKQETAIEIAKSCQLFQADMTLAILSSKTKEGFEEALNRYHSMYFRIREANQLPDI